MADVVLPALGETVTEARIGSWRKAIGDQVVEGEGLVDVETDKVDSELPSPYSGVLAEILAATDQTIAVGDVIARIAVLDAPDQPVAATPAPPAVRADSTTDAPTPTTGAGPRVLPVTPSVGSSGTAGRLPRSADPRVRSPLVRSMLASGGIDPRDLTGTGDAGRITRRDVEAAMTGTPAAAASAPAALTAQMAPTAAPAAAAGAEVAGTRWVPFTTVRRRTGERMALSAATIPQVTTIMEVDYERVAALRSQVGAEFKAAEGFSLTYLPFVASAVLRAIADFPHVNATFEGTGLRVHESVHLGIAVDLNLQGLLVPVARDAQELRLVPLARAFNRLATAARDRKLGVAEISGSTFTITNPGGYGTLAGTPLVNPPEVAILSLEGIAKRPVVVDSGTGDALAIHHVGQLSLTWDHRAIDGAYAAAFLARVRDTLQQSDWAALL